MASKQNGAKRKMVPIQNGVETKWCRTNGFKLKRNNRYVKQEDWLVQESKIFHNISGD